MQNQLDVRDTVAARPDPDEGTAALDLDELRLTGQTMRLQLPTPPFGLKRRPRVIRGGRCEDRKGTVASKGMAGGGHPALPARSRVSRGDR